jgi:hypothetical protein
MFPQFHVCLVVFIVNSCAHLTRNINFHYTDSYRLRTVMNHLLLQINYMFRASKGCRQILVHVCIIYSILLSQKWPCFKYQQSQNIILIVPLSGKHRTVVSLASTLESPTECINVFRVIFRITVSLNIFTRFMSIM